MTEQLWREARTGIGKVNDVPRESGIRLYCEQSGQSWNLQVRGPFRKHNGCGAEGKDYIVATASLSVEDLKALRASIDAHLDEAGASVETENTSQREEEQTEEVRHAEEVGEAFKRERDEWEGAARHQKQENTRLNGERDALTECLDMAVQGLEQAARTLRRQRSPSLRRDAAADMEGFLRTIGNLRPRSAPASDSTADRKPAIVVES